MRFLTAGSNQLKQETIGGVCAFWLLLFLFWGCSSTFHSDPLLHDLPFRVVLSEEVALFEVGGEQVEAEELRLISGWQRDRVLGYFLRIYGAEEDAGFWTRSFEGDRPVDRLLRLGLIETVKVKMRQSLARRLGIRNITTFESLRRRWEGENIRRKEVSEEGGQVYGPLQYTLEEYFEQDLRSLDLALMQRLEEGDQLMTADHFWTREAGESRLERQRRLYKAYIKNRLEEEEVRINRDVLLKFDPLAKPAPPEG